MIKMYQKGYFDCGIACIATILEKRYEEVSSLLEFNTLDEVLSKGKSIGEYNGLSMEEIDLMLNCLGFPTFRAVTKESLSSVLPDLYSERVNKAFLLTSNQLKSILFLSNSNAILEIDMGLKTTHTVVYDGMEDEIIDLSISPLDSDKKKLSLGIEFGEISQSKDIKIFSAIVVNPAYKVIQHLIKNKM